MTLEHFLQTYDFTGLTKIDKYGDETAKVYVVNLEEYFEVAKGTPNVLSENLIPYLNTEVECYSVDGKILHICLFNN